MFDGRKGASFTSWSTSFKIQLDAEYASPDDTNSLGDALAGIDQGGLAAGAPNLPGGNGAQAATARRARRQNPLHDGSSASRDREAGGAG